MGAATDMNSIPQQAVTNGYWKSENLRAQFGGRLDLGRREVEKSHGCYSHPTARLRQT